MFHAWASALEHAGDTRRADAVYVQGLESQAQPVGWLQAQHRYAALHSVVTPCRLCCFCIMSESSHEQKVKHVIVILCMLDHFNKQQPELTFAISIPDIIITPKKYGLHQKTKMTAYQHTSDFLHFRLCFTPQNVSIIAKFIFGSLRWHLARN